MDTACWKDWQSTGVRFLSEPGVPVDNNLAERDLRMSRLCRTAQKLGLNVLEAITAAKANPFRVYSPAS